MSWRTDRPSVRPTDASRCTTTDSVALKRILRLRPASRRAARSRTSAPSHETVERGYPDGMTVDAEGGLWCRPLGRVAGDVRYTPDGTGGALDRSSPPRNVTSCTFGGPELDTLFVTTASVGLDEAQGLEEQPLAGGLFAVESRSARSTHARASRRIRRLRTGDRPRDRGAAPSAPRPGSVAPTGTGSSIVQLDAKPGLSRGRVRRSPRDRHLQHLLRADPLQRPLPASSRTT